MLILEAEIGTVTKHTVRSTYHIEMAFQGKIVAEDYYQHAMEEMKLIYTISLQMLLQILTSVFIVTKIRNVN